MPGEETPEVEERSFRRSFWKRVGFWVPVVVYSGLIFFLSSRPIDDFPRVQWEFFDKVVHFGIYLTWGVLFGCPLALTLPNLSVVRGAALTCVGGTLYGVADEIHQSFVPGRSADPWDVAADSLGALAGALVLFWVLRSWRKRVREAGRSIRGAGP